MRVDIGNTTAQRSPGRRAHRSIKAKPRPKFPVRKRSEKPWRRIEKTTNLLYNQTVLGVPPAIVSRSMAGKTPALQDRLRKSIILETLVL
jgi:hypothetical protein